MLSSLEAITLDITILQSKLSFEADSMLSKVAALVAHFASRIRYFHIDLHARRPVSVSAADLRKLGVLAAGCEVNWHFDNMKLHDSEAILELRQLVRNSRGRQLCFSDMKWPAFNDLPASPHLDFVTSCSLNYYDYGEDLVMELYYWLAAMPNLGRLHLSVIIDSLKPGASFDDALENIFLPSLRHLSIEGIHPAELLPLIDAPALRHILISNRNLNVRSLLGLLESDRYPNLQSLEIVASDVNDLDELLDDQCANLMWTIGKRHLNVRHTTYFVSHRLTELTWIVSVISTSAVTTCYAERLSTSRTVLMFSVYWRRTSSHSRRLNTLGSQLST